MLLITTVNRSEEECLTVPAHDPDTMPHVFLAAPYSQWMDWDRAVLRPDRVAYLREIHQALLDAGYAVFSAHHNEQWGRSWLPAAVCTPADFLAVSRCDVMCAILGSPPSPGVLVEMGWASALGKPIVVLAEDELPQLVAGLETITAVARIGVRPDGWRRHVLAATLCAIDRLSGHQPTVPSGTVAGYPVTSMPLGYEVGGSTADQDSRQRPSHEDPLLAR